MYDFVPRTSSVESIAAYKSFYSKGRSKGTREHLDCSLLLVSLCWYCLVCITLAFTLTLRGLLETLSSFFIQKAEVKIIVG